MHHYLPLATLAREAYDPLKEPSHRPISSIISLRRASSKQRSTTPEIARLYDLFGGARMEFFTVYDATATNTSKTSGGNA